MIIADDQPFTTTENVHFRRMVKILNSDALVPTADTIKNSVMENFKEECEKRKILFKVRFYFLYIEISFS